MPTGLVYSERYLEHDTGGLHPERLERARTIAHRLHKCGLWSLCEPIPPTPADLEMIGRVHAPEYILRVEAACATGAGHIDTTDCPISPQTYEVALLAAGGAVTAVDAVMAGTCRNAFVIARPPGHHAERAQAMGFCFFNNIAIAAEHLRARHGLRRLAILDWDVHHGNGTQHHFEEDPDVFFCSIHQHPATMYPGTGYEGERGRGAGEGTTLNVPMQPRSGDEDYRRAFDELILPAIDAFAPEFLLISAGFDAHRADPLAHISLTTDAFAWMTHEVMALARKHCNNRLVSVLEGGYNLTALADSVQVHVEGLQGG